MTSRIILDVQLDGLDSQDVHHGDGLVRSHLGDGEGQRLIIVLADCEVYMYSIVKATLATSFRASLWEGRVVVRIGRVLESTCEACIDSFHNL